MLVLYIYVALAAYNVGYLTLSMRSVECLVDEAASVAVVDAEGKVVRNEKSSWRSAAAEGQKSGKKGGGGKAQSRQSSTSKAQLVKSPELDWRTLWTEGTDAVMDIPIGGVCEILYGAYDDEEEEEHDENVHMS